MRLRVPPALEHKYGYGRHVVFKIEFPYGHEELRRAWEAGLGITVRFVRKERKGEHVWYVHATTDRPVAERVTSRASGALGVDFNEDRVVASRVDRSGNPLWERHWALDLEGKTRGQRAALLGEAVADIVELARREGVPVVIERLDFEGKKARLRELGKGRARRVSAFAYRLFHRLVRSGAARKGVEVIEVDPAYTTVVGLVKFAMATA
jgi:IS605 OrfB family transposase